MTTPSTTSRQVVFTAANTIAYDRVDVPDTGADELLVRVMRVGICATDLHLLEGHIGDPFPLVPGHEFVGQVAAIGDEAARRHGVAEGDHVAVEMLLPCHACPRCREGRYNLCEGDDMASGLTSGRQYGVNIPRTVAPGLWGGYSDYLHVPAGAVVHRLPTSLSWERAVLVEPTAVASRAVERGRVRPGDTVAIIGPGPVGILAAAAARSAGAARVVMVGTRPERLEVARRFGVDETVDSNTDPDVVTSVIDALGGMADVVIEMAGVPAAQKQAMTLVRRGGRVVLAGACGSGAEVTLRSDDDLLTREIDVLASFLSAGGFEPAIALLGRTDIPFDDLVTHTFRLDEVEKAYDTVRERAEHVLKAVLSPPLDPDHWPGL